MKPPQKYTKPVSDLPEESFTLPSNMYTDPQVFEASKTCGSVYMLEGSVKDSSGKSETGFVYF